MNTFSKNDLKALTLQYTSPCISIFMPTHHQAGVEITQDPVRFKNLLREVENALLAQNLHPTQIKDLLQPLHSLLADAQFWKHPSDGVAIFRSPEEFSYASLPYTLKEQVVINDHFYLKPLLPLLTDGHFYILALSQNDLRLLESTHYSISQVELPESVPESLADALKYDEFSYELEYHSGGSGALRGKRGRRSAIFHGQGIGKDTAKDNLLRYFQQIDKGLHELLHNEKAPLVLAGVEYLIPIYREANTYPYLIEHGIPGNPDKLKADTLREEAWNIVEPYLLKDQQEALDFYKEHADTNQTSHNVSEIVPAASYGRIHTLFLASDQEQWGTFDPNTYTIDVHQTPQSGDHDLLDIAARQTFEHNGSIYVFEQAKMPDEALLAAIFRY